MFSSTRSSLKIAGGGRRDADHQQVGVDEGQVADEDGHPLAEPAGLAPPAGRDVAGGEVDMDGRAAPPQPRPVHHVVVEQGEGVEQLEGGAGVDHRRVGRVTAGADEGPVAEGRPEPLPAVEDEPAQRLDRGDQLGVDQPPAGRLLVQEGVDPGFDGRRHRRQARAGSSSQAARGREASRDLRRRRSSCRPGCSSTLPASVRASSWPRMTPVRSVMLKPGPRLAPVRRSRRCRRRP